MKSEKEIRSFMNDLETLSSACRCRECIVHSGIILGLRFALNMGDDSGRTPDAFAEAAAKGASYKKEAQRANPT